ncbi:MAG: hypothetical protein ACK502_03675 [Alphaproteobacteria bacterium]
MDIVKFFQDNIYSPEYGAKPAGVAVPLLAAGMGSLFGVVGAAVGGLGGALLAPVINKFLGKLGAFLGLSSAPVPGGVAKVPDMAIGEAKQATEEMAAPVNAATPTAEKRHIRAPILEHMKVPSKDVSDVIQHRRKTSEESAKIASMPSGTNKNLEERVRANWELIATQEKEIGDFVATLKNYQTDQKKYSGAGGEREKLVKTVASSLGITETDAATLVPVLPEIPAHEWKKGEFSDNPLLKADYIAAPEFEAIYNKRQQEGKLPAAYGNKKWGDLDTLTRFGYALNELNAEIIAVKQSINVHKINPDGEDLGHPDFNHGNLKRGFTCFGLYDDGSKWTRQNAAAVVTTLLARNPDDKVAELQPTGNYNTGWIKLYADYAISVSSSFPDSVQEYQKIKHYAELSEKRRYVMQHIEYLEAPLRSLTSFRNNALVKSRTEAEHFVRVTLPALNKLIDTKTDYEEAGLTVASVKSENGKIRIVFGDKKDAAKTYTIDGTFTETGDFSVEKVNENTTSPATIKLADIQKIKMLLIPASNPKPELQVESSILEDIAKAAKGALNMGVKFSGNEKLATSYPFVPAQALPFLGLNNTSLAA